MTNMLSFNNLSIFMMAVSETYFVKSYSFFMKQSLTNSHSLDW